jgi:superfamily II DNA or RNA helicase
VTLSLFDRAAPVRPAALVGRQLRAYQLTAFEGGRNADGEVRRGIRACLRQHRSTAVVCFTGGGKSSIAGQAAIEAPGRVLFLAHTDPLVGQARKELQEITGLPWELEQAGWTADARGDHHVVASVQSIMQERRLKRWPADSFSLIIVDEAHHYVASAFKRPLDYFSSAKILALTATPDRRDRKAMGRYIDSVAFKMDLVDAIREGWSVPIDCRPPIALDVDLSNVRTVTDKKSANFGDFREDDLEEKIKEVIGPIVTACLEQAGGMRTAIFTPRVESAHAAARALNERRPGCGRAIDGKMDKEVRRRDLADHRNGVYQFIANCGILAEGYSDRELRCLVDAKPTKSRAAKVQRLGRFLRPSADANVDACATAEERRAAIAASSKPNAVWIDLKFNFTGANTLVTPADLLGGSYSDKERASAKKALEKGGGDPLAALDAARKRLAAAANRAKVKLELGSFDPTAADASKPAVAPPSEGQLRACKRFGLEAPPTMAEATKLLRYEYLAQSKGWIDHQRRAALQQITGLSGRGMPLEEYRAIVSAWRANGKLRLAPEQLRRVRAPWHEPGSRG